MAIFYRRVRLSPLAGCGSFGSGSRSEAASSLPSAAEEAESNKECPVRNAFQPHAFAVSGDVFGFGRCAVRGAVGASQAGISAIRKPPLNALISEVREGVTDRRKLPVEDREQMRELESKIILSMRQSPSTKATRPSSAGALSASQAMRRSMSSTRAVSLAQY
jgi:hypothetical protein